MWIWVLVSCGPAEVAKVGPPSLASRAREAVEGEVPPPPPDCDLAAACPSLDLDPTRCVDDLTLFEVDMYGDTVAGFSVVDARVAALGLVEGDWYGLFPDPMGGCDLVVATFTVGGAP